MAKISMINRELKRQRIAKKYAAKRAALKETIRNPETSDGDRWDASLSCSSYREMRAPVDRYAGAG